MILTGVLLTVCVLALAFAFGGRAEREAAWVILAGLAVSIGLGALLGLRQQLPVALADLVLSVGFVLLSVRHRRAWLYVEATLALALTMAQVVSDQAFGPSLPFRLLVDGVDLVGLVLLLAAVAARRSRIRPAAVRIAD